MHREAGHRFDLKDPLIRNWLRGIARDHAEPPRQAAARLRPGRWCSPAELARAWPFLDVLVRVADLVATYWGTQRLTPNNEGVPVYGGSELCVARGDFGALLGLPLPEEARLAVAQARTYDDAAFQCFSGMFASRRNYDVARGRDAAGRARCGVLEQSWRIGGASGAEIAALEVFQADPTLPVVRTCCFELYGESVTPPPQATVYFHGVDEQVGPIIKYAMVQQHGDA